MPSFRLRKTILSTAATIGTVWMLKEPTDNPQAPRATTL